MSTAALIVSLFGCWLLCLPDRMRRWWTNEGGAVLAVTGLLLLFIMAAAGAI